MRGRYPEEVVHVVRSADAMRADLDARGVDAALLITDQFIGLAATHDEEYAVAIAQAFNRYLREQWLDPRRGLHGAILLPPQEPAAAAREIEGHAGAPGVAAGLLSTVHTWPLWGDPAHDPIFAAAQAARLPLILHGATTYGSVFPYQLQSYASPMARGALAQPLGAIANLTNLVTNGTLARFPGLRLLFCEAGLAWLPFLTSRLDGQYRHLKESAPELTLLPSEYVRRQVWCTTHPFSDVDRELIERVGVDRVLFGSDWPHFDRDDPAAVAQMLPAFARDRVMGGNARALFAESTTAK